MIILISANDLVCLFVGWEGVGLCSYLLVNFWYTRIPANKAALKALFVNRIGDCGVLIAIVLFIYLFKTTNFSILPLLVPFYSNTFFVFGYYYINIVNAIGFCLIIGVVGKSAQIGLHIWLPDAMEGPTPVSALIHAATMVTAGVFLVIKLSFFFINLPLINVYLIFFGSLTAFMAATIGLFQNDIKKIIAYSTCSQLGYMIFIVGQTNYIFSLFHLLTHAFFKALLFLSAGAIIHALQNEQDIRRMGSLRFFLPFCYISTFIGSLALVGFPFLAGFYSKDLIFEWTLTNYNIFSLFSFSLAFLAAICTAFYSFRLLILVFYSNPRASLKSYIKIHENPFLTNFVLFLLILGSIGSGYFLNSICNGLILGYSLLFVSQNYSIEIEYLYIVNKFLPTIAGCMGFSGALYIYLYCIEKINLWKHSKTGRHLYYFFYYKWFFDWIGNLIAHWHFVHSYDYGFLLLEKGILEKIGPARLTEFFFLISSLFWRFETNSLLYYFTWFNLFFFWWISFLYFFLF
jgi:proton-translocating NADH-quinone oxidoreductase chain L